MTYEADLFWIYFKDLENWRLERTDDSLNDYS